MEVLLRFLYGTTAVMAVPRRSWRWHGSSLHFKIHTWPLIIMSIAILDKVIYFTCFFYGFYINDAELLSSSSASIPTFMWGRWFLWDASIELDLALHHWTRSCASSADNYYLSNKSFLMLSNNLRYGLPLLPFPGTSIIITLLPTYSSYLLNKCPYHFNLLSCTFLDISPTFVVPLILSFLILSSLVIPLIHLNILISTTSNFFSCAFFSARVSAPYIIADLTPVMYIFHLALRRIRRSHTIPDTLFQFFILIVFYAPSPHPSLHSLPIIPYLNEVHLICSCLSFSPSNLSAAFFGSTTFQLLLLVFHHLSLKSILLLRM